MMIDRILQEMRELVVQQRNVADNWLAKNNLYGRDRNREINSYCDGVMRVVVAIENCPQPAGLYGKYRIAKADGTPTDPKAQYFVLRIDTDQAARMALQTYANYVEHDSPALADDLRQWLDATGPDMGEK